ncbi:hypothetical protein CPB86DRAFT_727619 [Serendipita vermifera]|nr:hypothetical protein CPB86DRAFT_727619 [Serendipita vermifera]
MTSTTSAESGSKSGAADEALFFSCLDSLKPIPVVFSDTYQAPPSLLPSRIAVLVRTIGGGYRRPSPNPSLPLSVLPPPEKKAEASTTNLADVLNVTFKSLKPAYTVSLPIQPANSILSLKTLLSSQQSTPLTGSTPDQLRLLLKGKALLDAKLVKDYDIKDGSTITVMSTSSKPAAPTEENTSTTPAVSVDLSKADRDPVPPAASPSLGATRPSHQRRVSDIPAVTLSPAGTPMATTPLLQPTPLSTDTLTHVPLVPASPQLKSGSIPIDLASIPLPISASHDDSPYHQTMASPEFWKELRMFLEQKFGKDAGGRPGDGEVAFEEFLRGAKVNLSPHEIARIRDAVGITGMGGH